MARAERAPLRRGWTTGACAAAGVREEAPATLSGRPSNILALVGAEAAG